MAFPALIQKIFNLRSAIETGERDRARLAAEALRLSNRVTALELSQIECAQNGDTVVINLLNLGPEGYKLTNGATVAPVTMVSESTERVDGATLTMVLDNK